MIKELQMEGTNRSYDATQVVGKEVTQDEINALCERMYQHALDLCKKNDDLHRLQKKVTASQLVQWRILVHFQDRYLPTHAWKLLTGDIDTLFPDALIQMALFKGNTRAVFLDRKEAKRPTDQQIEDAMVFVRNHINLGSRIAFMSCRWTAFVRSSPTLYATDPICLPGPFGWRSMTTAWRSLLQAD